MLSDVDVPNEIGEEEVAAKNQPQKKQGKRAAEAKRQNLAFAELSESRRASITQAYMLVYLREDVRKEILRPPALDEIPEDIKTAFDAENEVVDSM